eukprot:TRINITY_DN70275_c0_g1_i1.p1 TRINITY_DN70275_c0_g1~~TRINITY_DN70275_c0_g1_i1.p1  ORF type:complete len:406 (+),score=124.24 TRINITY_DN70275_c0_g1_i1:91-1218(+)
MAEELWRVARNCPAEGEKWEGTQPPALAEHAAAALEREGRKVMLVFGGWQPQADAHSAQLWEYDLRERRWTQLQPTSETRELRPRPRCGHCAAGGPWGMVVWGGWDGNEVLGDGWHLSAAASGQWQWLQLTDPDAVAPRPRRSAAMATLPQPGTDQATIFMHGGSDGAQRLGDLWRLSGSTAGGWVWREVSCTGTITPPPREGHAMAIDRERRQLVLFGGFTIARVNDLYTMAIPEDESSQQGQWCREASRQTGPPRPVAGHSAYVAAGALVVLFGQDAVERRDVAELKLPGPRPETPGPPGDPPELVWKRRSFNGDWPLQRRSYHSCCMTLGADGTPEGKLVVYGGWDGTRYLNSVAEMEFERQADAPVDKKKK